MSVVFALILTELPAKMLSFAFKPIVLFEVKLISPFVDTRLIVPEILLVFIALAIIEPESLNTLKLLPVLTAPLNVMSDTKVGFVIA